MKCLNQITHELTEVEFEEFNGDEEFLLTRVMSSNHLSNLPYKHESGSGLLSELGIDLGRCDVYMYYNLIDIRYSEVQSRIMSKRLFNRGADIVPFDANEMNILTGLKTKFEHILTIRSNR